MLWNYMTMGQVRRHPRNFREQTAVFTPKYAVALMRHYLSQ